jgi:hypothetical protein
MTRGRASAEVGESAISDEASKINETNFRAVPPVQCAPFYRRETKPHRHSPELAPQWGNIRSTREVVI